MNAVNFVLCNVVVYAIARVLTNTRRSDRDRYLREFAAFAAMPVLVQLLILCTGTLHRLSGVSLLFASVIAGLAICLVGARFDRLTNSGSIAIRTRHAQQSRHFRMPYEVVALAVLGVFVGLWLRQLIFDGTRYSIDDLSYHAPAVAHWCIAGDLSLPPTGKYAFYPMNSELVSLWFAIFFGDDALVGSAGFIWGMLAAASVAILVLQQGGTRLAALIAATLVLATPQVLLSAGTFSAVDLAGPASLLAAMVFLNAGEQRLSRNIQALGAVEDGHFGRCLTHLPCYFYAGALMGSAIGGKITFLPVGVVVGILILYRGFLASSVGFALKRVVAFGLAATITGAYWYVRNLLLTGNPLYPAEVGPFAGWQTAENLRSTELITWLLHGSLSAAQWTYLAHILINFPISVFALVAIGYLVSVFRQFTRRGKVDDQSSSTLSLLLVGLTLGVLFPFMPYSGTNENMTTLRLDRRFMLAPLLIGIALYGPLIRQRGRIPTFLSGFAAITIVTSALGIVRNLGDVSEDAAISTIVAVTILAGYLALRGWLSQGNRFASGWIPLAVVLLMSLLLVALHPARVIQSAQHVFHFHEPNAMEPIGTAWKAVNDLPAGSKIARFGRGAHMFYPLYGRYFQLTPYSHYADGAPRPSDYVAWKQSPTARQSEPGPTRNLHDELQRNGVNYLFVTKWMYNKWPPQHEEILRMKGLTRVFDDGFSEIWRMEPSADAASVLK